MRRKTWVRTGGDLVLVLGCYGETRPCSPLGEHASSLTHGAAAAGCREHRTHGGHGLPGLPDPASPLRGGCGHHGETLHAVDRPPRSTVAGRVPSSSPAEPGAAAADPSGRRMGGPTREAGTGRGECGAGKRTERPALAAAPTQGSLGQRARGPAPSTRLLRPETDSLPRKPADTGLSRPGPSRPNTQGFPVSTAPGSSDTLQRAKKRNNAE